MSDETCPEMVSQGDWSPRRRCGRPVKEDGLCGIHLRAKRTREQKDRERDQTRDVSDAAHDRAKLHARGLGIGRPHRTSPVVGTARYTGGLVLEEHEVLALIERLGAGR